MMVLLASRGVEKVRFQTLLKREKLNPTNEVKVVHGARIISSLVRKSWMVSCPVVAPT